MISHTMPKFYPETGNAQRCSLSVLRNCFILILSRWHSLSVWIKVVTRPLSMMGENGCTLESMVAYHYPPRIQDKTSLSGDFSGGRWKISLTVKVEGEYSLRDNVPDECCPQLQDFLLCITQFTTYYCRKKKLNYFFYQLYCVLSKL